MNVDTDSSKQATRCKAAYDDVLEEVLRMHNWNFAIFRQSLNKDASGAPIYGFANRFILPTIPKLIRLISVENDINYKLENNFLITDENNVNIKYIGKETDPNKYDPLFVNALAARLAAEVAFSLTGDSSGGNLSLRMQEEYINILNITKDRDYQEDSKKPIFTSSFNQARLSTFDVNINSNSTALENA